MAKLLRQVYAVWAKDEEFAPEYETKQKQAKEKEKAVGPSVVEPQSKGPVKSQKNQSKNYGLSE